LSFLILFFYLSCTLSAIYFALVQLLFFPVATDSSKIQLLKEKEVVNVLLKRMDHFSSHPATLEVSVEEQEGTFHLTPFTGSQKWL